MGCGSSEILPSEENNNINDNFTLREEQNNKYNNKKFNNDKNNIFNGRGKEIPINNNNNMIDSREDNYINNSYRENQFNKNKTNYYDQKDNLNYPVENKNISSIRIKRNNDYDETDYNNDYKNEDNYSRKKISVSDSKIIHVPEFNNQNYYNNDNNFINKKYNKFNPNYNKNNPYNNSMYFLNNNNKFNEIEDELDLYDKNNQEITSSILNKPNHLHFNFNCLQTLKISNLEVTCLILLSQTNELVSGSTDYLIKIFNMNSNGTFKLNAVLKGHTGSIIYLKEFIKCNTLISCSVDKSLKLWDIENLNCYMTLYGHKKSVLCCDICDNKFDNDIISGGDDCNIIIWTSNRNYQYYKKYVLFGHEKSVVCLLYISKYFYLASGSDDLTIRIWDSEKDYLCIKIFNSMNSEIYCMKYTKNRLICSCEDGNIYFFNLLVLKKVRSVQFSLSAVNDFDIIEEEKYLISASNDCKGRVWLIGTNERALLIGHTKPLSSIIYINGGLIATSSLDGTIKIWNKE